MKKMHESAPSKHLIPVALGSVLLILLLFTLLRFFYEQPRLTADTIAQDVQHLANIFAVIDKDCGILSFDYVHNPINFLTIKKDGFVGSEVGSMNLAHPEKWQGPYVTKNLHIQAKEYQVVQTYKGYFITPGQDVELPNGKRMGIDIKLDATSDIAAMAQDPSLLQHEGKPLAVPIATEKMTVKAELVTALEPGEV